MKKLTIAIFMLIGTISMVSAELGGQSWCISTVR